MSNMCEILSVGLGLAACKYAQFTVITIVSAYNV